MRIKNTAQGGKYMASQLKSFKNGIKLVNPSNLQKVILETIYKKRKECFDVTLEKLRIVIKSDPTIMNHFEEWFTASVQSPDPYYAFQLIDVNKNVSPRGKNTLLHIAIHFENEEVAHRLILSGADINTFVSHHDLLHGTKPTFMSDVGFIGTTVLEQAISIHMLELVCMLLYYGAYENSSENHITPLMFSIIYESSEEIQRLLIDYESDFNFCWNGMSTLFLAIKYNSPVTLEIIERGANINYYNGIHNIISLAIDSNCNPNIFRILWDQFDYEVWRTSFSQSVLMIFQEICIEPFRCIWLDYLNIFMEDEAKLRLDLEHYNNSFFYTTYFFITKFYYHCQRNNVQEETIASLTFHLLSHGAHIFKLDVDIIFKHYLLHTVTPFIDLLLYMDLYDSYETYGSFLYFKYSPIPNLRDFIIDVAGRPDVLSGALQMLRGLYALNNNLQQQVLDIVDPENWSYEVCTYIFQAAPAPAETLPSLLQLSRDSARKAICMKYNIENSCKLHTVIKYLPLPKYVQDILLLNKYIYYFEED